MTKRFVPPPNWPSLPPGWRPPTGWEPDARWGPPPVGWQFWQEKERASWFARHKVATVLLAAPLALLVMLFGLVLLGTSASSAPETVAQPAPFGQLSAKAAPTSTSEQSSVSRESPPSPASSEKASADIKARADAEKKRAAAAAAVKAQAAKQKAAKEKSAREKAAREKAAQARAAAAKEKVAKARAAAAKEKAAKARAAAAREKAADERAAKEEAAQEREEEAAGDCTPGYSPCLPSASDYDCAGGSGNGPKYVSGPVRVTGSDPYDLDRDGDGTGCDS